MANKADLIEAIAHSADISKASAERALNAALQAIRDALKNGEEVNLVGFGTFLVNERAARSGRNPRTGAAITIPSAKNIKFRAGKTLKDAIQ